MAGADRLSHFIIFSSPPWHDQSIDLTLSMSWFYRACVHFVWQYVWRCTGRRSRLLVGMFIRGFSYVIFATCILGYRSLLGTEVGYVAALGQWRNQRTDQSIAPSCCDCRLHRLSQSPPSCKSKPLLIPESKEDHQWRLGGMLSMVTGKESPSPSGATEAGAAQAQVDGVVRFSRFWLTKHLILSTYMIARLPILL